MFGNNNFTTGRKGNMRDALEKNKNVKSNYKEYIIDSLLSDDGNSCLVYNAHYFEDTSSRITVSHKVILKELFPQGLGILRDRNDALVIPGGSLASFNSYKKRFDKAYNCQVNTYQSERSTNITSNAITSFVQNNTIYIEMACDSGKCYSEVEDKNLEKIFKTVKAIAEAVKVYHDNGLIHCDIKPSNIFILSKPNDKSVTDIIKLFDFDSVCLASELKNSSIHSFSKSWAAPELCNDMLKDVSDLDIFKIDVYSIGAIIFWSIFDRMVEQPDRRYDSKWDIEFSKNPFTSCTPKSVLIKLTYILNKTIQSTTKNRFNIDELICELGFLLEAIKNKYGYSTDVFYNSSITQLELTKKELRFNQIVPSIIPKLVFETEKIAFNDLDDACITQYQTLTDCISNEDNNRLFLYAEKGGSGKTTHMVAAWEELLSNVNIVEGTGEIPIYISATNLSAKWYPILSEVGAKYGLMAFNDKNVENDLLGYLLNSKFNFVILIDGLNEIEESLIKSVEQDIVLLSSCGDKLKIIISSRTFPKYNSINLFKQLSIVPLDIETIEHHIGLDEFYKIKDNKKLLNLINNPMLLSIYKFVLDNKNESKDISLYGFADFIVAYNLTTVGELLDEYFKINRIKILKDNAITSIKTIKSIEKTLINIAFFLYENNSFIFNCFNINLEDICVDDSAVDLINKYNLIKIDDSGILRIHQLFRDFLTAKYLFETITRNISSFIDKMFYSIDVLQYLGEICRDYTFKPFFNKSSGRWEKCQSSKCILEDTLNLFRDTTTCYGVSNIIQAIALQRDNDLSGLDMTNLDLSSILLSKYRWSRRNFKGDYFASSFVDSKFLTNNWIQPNFSNVTAMNSFENLLLVGSDDGRVFIWNLKNNTVVSEKKISEHAIRQFLKDDYESSIFVLSANIVYKVKYKNNFKVVSVETLLNIDNEVKISEIFFEQREFWYCTYEKPTVKKRYSDGISIGSDIGMVNSPVQNERGEWIFNAFLSNTPQYKPYPIYKCVRNGNCEYSFVKMLEINRRLKDYGFINCMKYNNNFTLLAISTSSNYVFIVDHKSNVDSYFFPTAHVRGMFFHDDGTLYIYGNEIHSISGKEPTLLYDGSSDKIISYSLPSVDAQADYSTRYLYILRKNSLSIIDFETFSTINIIDVDTHNEGYVISPLYKDDIRGKKYDYLAISKSIDKMHIYNTTNGTKQTSHENKFELVWASHLVKFLDSPFDKSKIRLSGTNTISFFNHETGCLIFQKEFTEVLRIQGCKFSMENCTSELISKLKENNIVEV